MNYLVILFMITINSSILNYKLKYAEFLTDCKFTITSHNRTIGHNKYVGGIDNSFHTMSSIAYDIVPTCNKSYKEIGYKLKGIFKGVILYKTHIHVDDGDRTFTNF